MTTKKVTQLPEDTGPSTDDLVMTVDSPGSSPTSKKLTVANLLKIVQVEYVPIGYAIDGTAPPASEETITSTNKVKVRKFAGDTADEDVQIPWQVPSDFSGSTITFRVVCLITEATIPSNEGIVFALQGASIGTGDALGAALGTAVISEITGRSDAQYDIIFTGWSAAVTVTNIAAGEMAILSLYRDQDHDDDTYAQDVGVIGIELKYTKQLAYS